MGAQTPFGTRGPTSVGQLRGLPSTVYVGQSLDFHVIFIAGPDQPSITMPTSPDLSMKPIDQPIRRSLPEGRVEYDFPVRFVVNRAGTLQMPPIRLTDGDRDAATIAREIQAKMPRASGRTAEFLGGVGRIIVSAEAHPPSIPLGDSFEFRVKLAGPGSPGSVKPVALELVDARIQVLEPVIDLKTLSRILRFTIRPNRAGSLTIPPIRVAWFDPVSLRYQTTPTNSIRVNVSRPPIVTPYPSVTVVAREDRSFVWWLIGPILLFLIGSAVTVLWRKGDGSWSSRRRLRRLAEQSVSRLTAIKDERLFARTFMNAVSEIIESIDCKAPRAVTPIELRSWLISRTTSYEVAELGHLLVLRCDQILYSTLSNRPLLEPSRECYLQFLDQLTSLAANKPGTPWYAGFVGSGL